MQQLINHLVPDPSSTHHDKGLQCSSVVFVVVPDIITESPTDNSTNTIDKTDSMNIDNNNNDQPDDNDADADGSPQQDKPSFVVSDLIKPPTSP